MKDKGYKVKATKIKNIDIDNVKLLVVVESENHKQHINIEMQYNIKTNTVHHNDEKAEQALEMMGVDIDDIAMNIEKREIKIN